MKSKLGFVENTVVRSSVGEIDGERIVKSKVLGFYFCLSLKPQKIRWNVCLKIIMTFKSGESSLALVFSPVNFIGFTLQQRVTSDRCTKSH